MPEFTIRFERPDQPDVLALIDALDAYQIPLYPIESHHGIELKALLAPNVVFVVARDNSKAAIGCGAVVLESEYAELKRMWVVPSWRNQGVAAAVLQSLEDAVEQDRPRPMMLETGYLQTAAIRMYERAGYVRCLPFGSYVDDPNSVFMVKHPLGRHCKSRRAG
jgi:putative acetyltransferase